MAGDYLAGDAGGGEQIAFWRNATEANGFRKRIETAISRLTVPVHQRVTNVEILEGDGPSGYVATLVKRSEFGPVRAIAGELDNYYVRVGDSFKTAPHAVLKGMFGRAPMGVVWVQLFSMRVGMQAGSGAISLAFGFGIANGGATLLERPYVSVQPGNATTNSLLRVSAVRAGETEIFQSMTGNYQALSNAGAVIVPGGVRDLYRVQFAIQPGVERVEEGVAVEIVVGVANAIPKRLEIVCTREEINNAIAKARGHEMVDTGELFHFKELTEALKAQL